MAGESVALTKALVESDTATEPFVAIRSAVEYIFGRGAVPSGEELQLTPRAKRVIELAKDEARWFGDTEVSSWHLLVGIMREAEGIGSAVLEQLREPYWKGRERKVH